MEGEALERAGKTREAVKLFVQSAVAEEESGQPLRARILWEQVASRAGATGTILERLANASERAKLRDEAFDYWAAAAASYHGAGREDDARKARERAAALAPKVGPHERPALARPALDGPHAAFVADLIAGR
jgi:hypothetical protein